MFKKFVDWSYAFIRLIEKKQLHISCEDLNASRELSTLLMKRTDIETITNILEWQEQNISYWFERADSSNIVYYTFFGILFLLSLLTTIPTSSTELVLLIVTYMILFTIYRSNFVITLHFILILSIILYYLARFRINLPFFYIGFGLLAGIIFGIYIFSFFKYGHMMKKSGSNSGATEILSLLSVTFDLKLPINQLLKYKFAVCRDYAVLSSALLINLNLEPFYLLIPNHVATAARIDGIYYVIDQTLPIRRLDRWLNHHNVKECTIYKASKDDISSKVKIEFIQKYAVGNSPLNTPNIEKLESDINNYFGLSQKYGSNPKPVPIGNKAAFFYDEVTHLSVLRKAVIEIEKQFCNNISKVSHIKIEQLDKDLVAVVYW